LNHFLDKIIYCLSLIFCLLLNYFSWLLLNFLFLEYYFHFLCGVKDAFIKVLLPNCVLVYHISSFVAHSIWHRTFRMISVILNFSHLEVSYLIVS
jgi:hypothetical protein